MSLKNFIQQQKTRLALLVYTCVMPRGCASYHTVSVCSFHIQNKHAPVSPVKWVKVGNGQTEKTTWLDKFHCVAAQLGRHNETFQTCLQCSYQLYWWEPTKKKSPLWTAWSKTNGYLPFTICRVHGTAASLKKSEVWIDETWKVKINPVWFHKCPVWCDNRQR